FGELAPAGLSGLVYSDADNDGVPDVGETGIASVTVTLSGTDDRGAAVNLTTTTNAAGQYNFGNLRPGTYQIAETQPAGFFDGKDSAGNTGGTLGNDTVTNIVLTPVKANTGVTFGELAPAGLSGFVYGDADDDGVAGGGE